MSIKKMLFGGGEEERAIPAGIPEEVAKNLIEVHAERVRGNRRNMVTSLFSIMLAVLVWFVLSATIMPNLPNPGEFIQAAIIQIQDPNYYKGIVYSVARVYGGFSLGCLVGIPMGLMMGWNRTINQFMFPTFELIRPIPPVAWVPLSIILTGAITPAIIFITFIGTWYVVTLNSVLGAESLDPSMLRAARCLGAKNRQIFRHIVLPGSLSAIFTGMVLGMAMSWITVVAGEMIAGDYGIGYLAWQSYSLIRYPEVIVAMLTIGGLGYASSMLIRILSNRFLRWRQVYG
ncbi:MAG: ABC transporter permease [Nitrososphaerales archaeon]